MYARNVDEAVRFLTTALPEFQIRGRGGSGDNEWLHIGTDESYLALSQHDIPEDRPERVVNHLGFVVSSVAEVKERLLAAGFREGYRAPDHPYRKRLYFLDADGLEWEFVEYLSADPAQRNDYSQ